VLRTCLVLALLGAFNPGLHAEAQQLSPAESAGRKIFQTRCAMCHVGQDPATEMGLGTGAAAPRRPSTFGPLLSRDQAADEAKLRDKITNGSARMPAYRLALTQDEIGQVIAFLKTVEQRMTKLALPRAGE
jgi:mono/diheme cytochrome c family protein